MERFGDEELKLVEQVIRSGELSRFFTSFKGGKFVLAFEQNFADYIGTMFAVSCCNGTVALELALASMGIKRGDEIVTTPLTFIATGTAILRVGAKPVFVDIEKETLNIDPAQIKKAITSKTKAIIPVSLNGMPCEMDSICEIAEKKNILVLEDAAQALGAEINGQKIGSFGHIGSFSFQESKTITTLGEGGMIVTDDSTFYERALNIRNHGNIYGTMNDVCCTNMRLTEAQAAFGVVQLRKLDKFNKTQTENAEYFLQHLKSPPFRSLYSFPIPKGVKPTYYLMPVVEDSLCNGYSREYFLRWAKDKGISLGVPSQNIGYYKKLIYEAPIFRNARVHDCPNARWAKDNVLLFDIHRWKTIEYMKKVLAVL